MLLISNIIINVIISLMPLIDIILIIINLEDRNLLSEVSNQGLTNSVLLLLKHNKR